MINPTKTKKTILIVEDDSILIKILVKKLQENYTVFYVNSTEAAEEFINKNKPDLILLDIVLPKECGFKFCLRLKFNKPTADIPVIFITSYDVVEHETIAKLAYSAGGNAIIRKPIIMAILLKNIEDQLELADYRRINND